MRKRKEGVTQDHTYMKGRLSQNGGNELDGLLVDATSACAVTARVRHSMRITVRILFCMTYYN
jgi:hypothetical protein